MVHCCILGCNSRSERKAENITFHTFPKNDFAVRQLWIRATGRENWQPTKFTRICSRHFHENCFRRTQHMTYLNPFSVPTLHVVELIPPMQKPSTSKKAMDLEKSPDKNLMPIEQAQSTTDEIITPRKQKLVKQLNRQKLLAQTRKRKLALLRSKYRRLAKKNAEMSSKIRRFVKKY